MKLLFILGVLAFLLLFIYLRLRPFIRAAREMFGVAREAQRVAQSNTASSARATQAGDHLVRCASCSTWVPSSRAIRLRSSDLKYCSHACLETAAQVSKQKKAAS